MHIIPTCTPSGSARDARPIRKGRLGKPVEFGYKAQVRDNDDGIIVDHALEQGNPADGRTVVCVARRRASVAAAVRGRRQAWRPSVALAWVAAVGGSVFVFSVGALLIEWEWSGPRQGGG